jgi:hypothetical protein
LGEVQSIAKLLAQTKKSSDRAELRTRIKARIRGLVSEMWLLIDELPDDVERTCCADFQIHFHAGGLRRIQLHWSRRGPAIGTVRAMGSFPAPTEFDSPMPKSDPLLRICPADVASRLWRASNEQSRAYFAVRDLRHYRDDAIVQAWFDGKRDLMAATNQAAEQALRDQGGRAAQAVYADLPNKLTPLMDKLVDQYRARSQQTQQPKAARSRSRPRPPNPQGPTPRRRKR